ncbi:MAG: 2'-5' RNA ligase family protein [Chlorobium sp.]|uniref:2'-5' RNA ligase family protein n=1 Tax=Chlorobium sp. TaxID=1095 RepID=UPI0025C563ED|nr:2'-5' RNA ligase family protein [Chlorobium sp.]MCF8217205.1 2'-5' RNA ligase family protein [Chlorobium sp.]MCF8272062.1 2'-5' RNA ligase family protein [Chlorobium sp.]MCF8288424.1 2'-5' RNA ligase family protein [Chlorobium sp.]MCF8292014.1 2'-5' RNA ligase family protein [Chlorobium sp.]MCF8386116.1 2'-5' RNA ligase family protein [Chlorobium sp.]
MGTASKRVFIGIPAGEELREQVLAFHKQHARLPVRWIQPQNLHLTVVPPWLCDKPELVCSALGDVAALFASTDVQFTSVSAGPDAAEPHLIWATGNTTQFFSTLRHELYSRISLQKSDERPFFLHLTIARVRRDEQQTIIRMKFRAPVVWNACLRGLSLYESVLKPTGAEYRVLCGATFSHEKQ